MNKYQKKKEKTTRYKRMIYDCFTEVRKSTIDKTCSMSKEYEYKYSSAYFFRISVIRYLENKGYSVKQINDLMDLYSAILAVGFMGSVAININLDRIQQMIDDLKEKEHE